MLSWSVRLNRSWLLLFDPRALRIVQIQDAGYSIHPGSTVRQGVVEIDVEGLLGLFELGLRHQDQRAAVILHD